MKHNETVETNVTQRSMNKYIFYLYLNKTTVALILPNRFYIISRLFEFIMHFTFVNVHLLISYERHKCNIHNVPLNMQSTNCLSSTARLHYLRIYAYIFSCFVPLATILKRQERNKYKKGYSTFTVLTSNSIFRKYNSI